MQTAKFQFEEPPKADPLGAQSPNDQNGSSSPPKHDISSNAVLASSSTPIKDLLEVYHKTKIPHPDEDIYLQVCAAQPSTGLTNIQYSYLHTLNKSISTAQPSGTMLRASSDLD